MAGDAILPAILFQTRDPEAVRLVRTLDRDAKLLGKRPRLAAMVDMAVGEDDLLDSSRRAVRRRRLQPRQIAAGIDERPLHRGGAPEQGAVLLKRSDGHDRGPERRSRHGPSR